MKNGIKYLIILLTLLAAGLQSMATVNVQVNPDGSRATGVLINGSTTAKFDIVFVGDGFTSSAADQTRFNNAVNDAIHAMQNKHPYQDHICGFNVWRVNVISAEAGVDHPVSGITKNTELNCSFGNNITRPQRAIFSATPDRVTEAANFAPAHDCIYVLVNDNEYGGASGDIVYTSLESSMQEVVVHELGHFVGRLADEYPCRYCDGRVEPGYSGPEPTQANITIQTNRALVKWGSLINAATPLPTTLNSPAGVVGLWQGGFYSPTVVYRPQRDCLMRILNEELCAVCNNALSRILGVYCTICERFPNSIGCTLVRFRHRFDISDSRFFRIPLCCFCPLDGRFRTIINISVNPELYDIQVLTDSKNIVQASITGNQQGGTSIAFQEQSNTSYFLSIVSRSGITKPVTVDANIARDGQQSVLF
ncbi:MAG: M64 family metallopeptidase [Ferruginibacter sp.]